jgi:hypothetical protein
MPIVLGSGMSLEQLAKDWISRGREIRQTARSPLISKKKYETDQFSNLIVGRWPGKMVGGKLELSFVQFLSSFGNSTNPAIKTQCLPIGDVRPAEAELMTCGNSSVSCFRKFVMLV